MRLHFSRLHISFLIFTLTRIIPVLGSADVTDEVFGGLNKDVFPVAFADYDADKKVDMVVLTRNLSSFDIYFGSNTEPFLEKRRGFQCDLHYNKNGKELPVQIVGLVLADFTGDGINDICVSFKPVSILANDTASDSVFVSIFRGDLNYLHCGESRLVLNQSSVYLEMRQEPMVLDVNGDMIADLVGEVRKGQRWIFMFSRDSPPKQYMFSCGNGPCTPLSTPSVGGFVDLDGDFSPDLVLVSQAKGIRDPLITEYFVEVYDIDRRAPQTTPTLQFKMKKKINLIQNNITNIAKIGNPVYLDINLKGKELQIVIPYCGDKHCTKGNGLMLVDYVTGKASKLDVKFEDNHGQKWTFLSVNPDTTIDYSPTINIRVGDFDLDGYPDILCTLMQAGISSSQAQTRPVLFMNVPCEKECRNPRAFKANFDMFYSYPNAINTAFYDFNDNGLLDIIGVRRVSSQARANATYGVFVVENRPEYDAYFIKWLVTTGRCEGSCPPYGVMTPGASMKYTVMDVNNKDKSGRASQVVRGNFALDLPGGLMGTGPSPNFIDQVTFGIASDNTYVKSQVIPNSNLIAIPSGPGQGSRWEVKHLITPSVDGAIATFHVLLLICIVNASVVFVFYLREKKEDRIERSKNPVSMSALTFT